jgi:hypothetical protein
MKWKIWKWIDLPEDDVLRAVVPVGIPILILLVIGAVQPIVVVLFVVAGVPVAALFLAYLLVRLMRKLLHENCGTGGILESWRPSIGSGLLTAIGVLARWAPFGFLSLLIFGANGLIVDWIAQLAQLGIIKARGGAEEAARKAEDVAGWMTWIPFSALRDAARWSVSTMEFGADALGNLLVLVRFVCVVETYLSVMFLIWLTTRTVMYFLARTVLADRTARGVAEDSPIEVRFNMETLR